jgi:hypothetical protein
MMQGRRLWLGLLLSIPCLLLVIGSVSAAPSSYGYAVSLGGVSYLSDSNADIGSAGLSLVAAPIASTVLEPSVFLEAKFALRGGFYDLHDLNLGINLTLFKTIHHPFGFLMPINPTLYAPALQIALHHVLDKEAPLRLVAGVSLFRLLEKDAWSEWLSPFVIINPQANELEAWGITLWRFTYLVH